MGARTLGRSLPLTPTPEDDCRARSSKKSTARLGFLVNVGLDYLTLHRSAATLSGGEAQRIRLATQIGSRLVGVLYVLDEPSIGLHPRDNARLLETLKDLRDLGNTVLVVEHDEETIRDGGLGDGSGSRRWRTRRTSHRRRHRGSRFWPPKIIDWSISFGAQTGAHPEEAPHRKRQSAEDRRRTCEQPEEP